MKKSIFAIVGGILMITAVSCKKDHTCECTYSDSAGNSQSVSTTYNATKKDAEEACDAAETTVTVGTESYTWACELK